MTRCGKQVPILPAGTRGGISAKGFVCGAGRLYYRDVYSDLLLRVVSVCGQLGPVFAFVDRGGERRRFCVAVLVADEKAVNGGDGIGN
jgi:hypothetical protein